MELINRNALLSGWTGMAFSGDSRQIILEQPIIDAVPVVRCKDCIHYGEVGDCEVHPYDGSFNVNYFCADGEKKA